MGIIAMGVSGLFLVICLYLNRPNKSLRPDTLFFALWTFILFLSVLNLYNIYKPSNKAYFLILLMVSFFGIGSLFATFFSKRKKYKEINKKDNLRKSKIKEYVFYIFMASILIFNIIDIIIIIMQLNNGVPMWQIRNLTLEPFGSSNPILDRRSFIENVFRNIILQPFSALIYPVTAYLFFNCKNKKKKYILLLSSILILITSSIAGGGGRLAFITFFGCFLLALIIKIRNQNNNKELIKKYKKIIGIFFIFAVVFVVGFTVFRAGINSIFKQVYTYFALPPTLLSLWLPKLENVQHTFGMTSFFGVYSYIFRILGTLGFGSLVPSIYAQVFNHILNAEIFVNVGYGVANAFVTPIYYFFIDGGYLFVCLASFLFGFVALKQYNKFEKNINLKSFTYYCLIMYGVFISFMRIQTAIPNYIISFIMTFLLIDSKEKNKEKNNCYGTSKTDIKEKISIIVPVYNAEQYLNKCIESILKQTYQNFEIILIDDGSEDNSGNICDEYEKNNTKIKVIHQTNSGVCAARNVGIDNAKGDWISFVDADDYIETTYLEELIYLLKKFRSNYITCGYKRVFDAKKVDYINSDLSIENISAQEYLNKLLNVQNGYGFVHMKLIKKDVIKGVRFNEKITVGEDALFNVELCKNLENIIIYNKPLYNYYFNPNSAVRKFDTNYAQKYISSMKTMKEYIENEYKDDKIINKNLQNYIAYHELLVCVNYCYHPQNSGRGIELLKKINNIDIFKNAIKSCNYTNLSVTRQISIFALKHKLYHIMELICKIRQKQFKK